MYTYDSVVYHGGWVQDPDAVYKVMCTLPMPLFRKAVFNLFNEDNNSDVALWDFEQAVLGKVLPSMDQSSIGSCVSHGYGRASQDLLLVQIAAGAQEMWEGEVAREPIYGGSRVQVGGERSGEGSVGAWAAKWLNQWGIVLYAANGNGLDGYYTVDRCRQYGSQGVPSSIQTLAKKMPVGTISCVTSPEDAATAIRNGYPIGICGMTSRTMKRQKGGWCPKTGNQWSHCQALRGAFTVGGSNSPFGGDGAFPYAGNTLAIAEQNSWGDYLGSDNATFTTAAGKQITLPMGCYLTTYDEIRNDLREGDSFALSHATGFPAQKLDKILFKIAGV